MTLGTAIAIVVGLIVYVALVPNPRDLPDLLHTIARVKPAFFSGVPTLYTAILNHPQVRAGKIAGVAAGWDDDR